MKSTAELSRQLRRKLRWRGTSGDDADDLIQEAFLRFEIYRRDRTVRNPEAFVARTALNLAIDARRHRQVSPLVELTSTAFDVADPGAQPPELLTAQARLARMNAGLAELSDRTRSILLAQRVDGLSYSEIAAREGISVSAVEKHIARAVLFLAEWMAE